ncbi:hypothetical protein [Rhizobium leguminosarum]|uniref:hypothetical protein n=1 Tax=Rhizobium leguminosarum TaxID=384 RepID=UPI00102FB98D|nr:hypothetical protein [Rhizobium leguminosarum]TAU73494.1 hypothetical protein ELI40_31135 [Rhizobium leguminosarum]TAX02891.1 hypothetical protein ELI07_31980 [Rhizobium leguminosarum]TAY11501.1 hypothetical protein ELH96_06995 [Rhizobium leguminosarum]TAZ02743.1 hypothetical protein ELH81_33230 [Rhizobium leguminosarum]
MRNPILNNFEELESCYDQLMSWCDVLQAIADFLPCHIDESLCGRISRGLIPLLLTTHQLEERSISSALGLIMEVEELADARERRYTGRLFDLDAAQHVVFTLETLSEGRCRLSWEAVGYQLRSFFCSMRRHIKSEREIIRLLRRATDGEPASRSHDATAQTDAA